MSIDLEGEKKQTRGKERTERLTIKTEERPTLRVRPGGSVFADRLAAPQWVRDKYSECVFYWENDEAGRPEQREARGWVKVKSDMDDGKAFEPGEQRTYSGGVVRIPVGRGNTTDNLYAVLMMLPREWYEADRREQEEQNRKLRESLRRGPNTTNNPLAVGSKGEYAPRLPNGEYGFSEKLGGK